MVGDVSGKRHSRRRVSQDVANNSEKVMIALDDSATCSRSHYGARPALTLLWLGWLWLLVRRSLKNR
jgi:hypothetical protein